MSDAGGRAPPEELIILKRSCASHVGGVIVALCAAVWSPRAGADELLLVEDGVNRPPIVTAEDAPPLTRLAAKELATYMEKVSGARPRVIEATPDEPPASAIWVGYQPMLETLFPEQTFDFAHPEQILIATNGEHLVIAGRDRWAE